MNILIIDNSSAFTGAFKCALNEAELLSANHKFIFVVPEKSSVKPYLQEKGIKYYSLNMLEIRKSPSILLYPLLLLLNTFKVQKIIRKESIDVVQCNDFYNLIGVFLKILGYKGKLITYVRFIPSVMPSYLRKIWVGLAQKYAYRVIAVSDTVLRELPEKSNTIRLYDPANLKEAVKSSEKTEGIVRLLYLSNYIRGKGQDYALEAFIKAYKINASLRLQFTGGDMGLYKNRMFKEQLQQRVTDLSLTNIITFSAFNNNIEAEIKAADIVLNFSDAESLSMTCLEAAYYGTTLIATRCGGPEEIIIHEQTGILVPVRDIEAMSSAIVQLSNDKNMRESYANAGKIYVRNKFSKEEFIAEFENILNQGHS